MYAHVDLLVNINHKHNLPMFERLKYESSVNFKSICFSERDNCRSPRLWFMISDLFAFSNQLPTTQSISISFFTSNPRTSCQWSCKTNQYLDWIHINECLMGNHQSAAEIDSSKANRRSRLLQKELLRSLNLDQKKLRHMLWIKKQFCKMKNGCKVR